MKTRVEAYWNYRIRGELDKAYEYEYPLFKKKVSLLNYIQRYSNPLMKYRAFEIREINFKEEDIAEVTLKVDVRVKVPGIKAFEHDTQLTGRWARMNGDWYHVPRLTNSFTH